MSKEKLALKGGKPVREKPIPQSHRGYGWQFIGEEEKKSVFEALDDRLAGSPRGPRVRRLEKEFASVIGTKYALGCVNGCLSELMIMAASGIGPGDEVIVPAFTWWAPAQTTLAANAMPIIAEVDDTLNLEPADFEAKITKRTKAVWVVDMVGAQARMDEIMDRTPNSVSGHNRITCSMLGLSPPVVQRSHTLTRPMSSTCTQTGTFYLERPQLP